MTEHRLDDHNARQRAHFAIEAADNPRMRPSDTPYVQRHVDRMVAWADLRPDERILDIGCGMGKFTLPLLRRGFQVDGLDLSPELLDQLRAHLRPEEAPDLACTDLLDVPAHMEGRYDVVVGFFMLHHLLDLTQCFRAMHRYLRPGGRVAFLEPNALNPLYYLQITFTPGMSWRSDRGVTRMTQRRLTTALASAGFVDVAGHREGMLPPFVANRPRGRELEDRLDRARVLEPVSAFQLVRGVSPG